MMGWNSSVQIWSPPDRCVSGAMIFEGLEETHYVVQNAMGGSM